MAQAADATQAAYFRGTLADERQAVDTDLAGARDRLDALTEGKQIVGLRGMSRARFKVRELENDLRELNRLIGALDRAIRRSVVGRALGADLRQLPLDEQRDEITDRPAVKTRVVVVHHCHDRVRRHLGIALFEALNQVLYCCPLAGVDHTQIFALRSPAGQSRRSRLERRITLGPATSPPCGGAEPGRDRFYQPSPCSRSKASYAAAMLSASASGWSYATTSMAARVADPRPQLPDVARPRVRARLSNP